MTASKIAFWIEFYDIIIKFEPSMHNMWVGVPAFIFLCMVGRLSNSLRVHNGLNLGNLTSRKIINLSLFELEGDSKLLDLFSKSNCIYQNCSINIIV